MRPAAGKFCLIVDQWAAQQFASFGLAELVFAGARSPPALFLAVEPDSRLRTFVQIRAL